MTVTASHHHTSFSLVGISTITNMPIRDGLPLFVTRYIERRHRKIVTQTAVNAPPRSGNAIRSGISALWTKVEENNITPALTTGLFTDFEVLLLLDASCKIAIAHSDVVLANTEQAVRVDANFVSVISNEEPLCPTYHAFACYGSCSHDFEARKGGFCYKMPHHILSRDESDDSWYKLIFEDVQSNPKLGRLEDCSRLK